MSGSSAVNLEQSIEESIEFQIKLEYFWKFRNWSSEVPSDVGVTRDQLDNENNNQSQDSNILNNIHEQSLIYRVKEQSISQGYLKCKRKHSEAMYT